MVNTTPHPAFPRLLLLPLVLLLLVHHAPSTTSSSAADDAASSTTSFTAAAAADDDAVFDASSIAAGSRVRALWRDGGWYRGTILRVLEDRRTILPSSSSLLLDDDRRVFHVMFDDGDRRDDATIEMLTPLPLHDQGAANGGGFDHKGGKLLHVAFLRSITERNLEGDRSLRRAALAHFERRLAANADDREAAYQSISLAGGGGWGNVPVLSNDLARQVNRGSGVGWLACRSVYFFGRSTCVCVATSCSRHSVSVSVYCLCVCLRLCECLRLYLCDSV